MPTQILISLTAVSAALTGGSPRLTRREVASLAAGSYALSGSVAPATATPFQQQPGVKLNTGTNFPFCSFGLQVYDDECVVESAHCPEPWQ